MASVLSAPHFHDEKAAYKYLEARVWPNGPVCPKCGGVERISKMEGESTPITRRDDEGNTFQTRRLENGNAFEVLKNYPTEQELRDAMQGFAEFRELRWLKHYWCLRSELPAAH